jgi:spore germination cell wall hydrolase CwlJ-like protein
MRALSRAALLAASGVCLLSTVAIAVPSFASETSAPAGTATAMLAAVTAPLLTVDVNALEKRDSENSSSFTPGSIGAPAATDAMPNAAQPPVDHAELAATPQTLEDLVAAHQTADAGDEQANCLATTVYFESKGEPLTGQLAVAQTILNRTASGRFPESVCGVVRQSGQFSFVHGGSLPSAPQNAQWKRAVAVAIIAREGLWKQVAPDALFFHARSSSPGWGKMKVASLGNQIFYR